MPLCMGVAKFVAMSCGARRLAAVPKGRLSNVEERPFAEGARRTRFNGSHASAWTAQAFGKDFAKTRDIALVLPRFPKP
jgi:hypothetical protein